MSVNADAKQTPMSEAVGLPEKKKSAPVIRLPLKKVTDAVANAKPTDLRPRDIRRRMLRISFVLCVIVPTLLCSIYYLFIASDRYVATAGFSVRSMDATATGSDFLGSLTGLASVGTTTTDSYIILEYLKSRELIEKLRGDIAFDEAYSSEKIDFLYKLDRDLPIEDIVDYWDWMITPSFDNASSIITFEVQAFTAEDAEKIAELIVQYCQALVNKLSAQARRDAVQFAEREVSTAQLRLKLIREELRNFRAQSSAVDPSAVAAAQLELVTTLQGQLIELRSRLATLTVTLSESAPPVKQLRKQIASLEAEIAIKRSEVGGLNGDNSIKASNLSKLLADFEKLRVEQEFAQQAYVVSLSSLERARAEADRQQRFLAVFKSPSRPQNAIYPERVLNSFLAFVVVLIFWVIGVLLVYSVRDHMR